MGRAQRVGGVGGALREGVHQGAQGFGVSVVRQDVPEDVGDARRDGLGPPGGQRSAARPAAGREGLQDGTEEGAQGAGAVGARGEGRRAQRFCTAHRLSSRCWAGLRYPACTGRGPVVPKDRR
ncbi:hypothetical protein GCM10010260_68350 [Streptomyces filipinensis]|uniref:Uncharacterized protein n=1 Tax=Streptomyces filipinensis TaxID=66887 RepID=A0A918MDV9_9ACTN|nr:hypothetical protein GCM10010260_68350 [Streptomyces filipinensis]